MTLYRPVRSRMMTTKIKSRIAGISNKFLYNNIPPLTPNQVKTLIAHPEMTEQLIQKFGPKIVQTMLSKSRDRIPPTGLMPESMPPDAGTPPSAALGRPEVKPPPEPTRKYKRAVFLASLEQDKQSDEVLKEERDKIVDILNTRMPTVGLIVEYPDQVEDLMRPFNPNDTIVINWADSVGQFPHGGQHIAETLARLGFDDAGSSAMTQEIMTDRNSTRKFLETLKVPIPQWRLVSTPLDVRYWKGGYPALVRPNAEHGSAGLKEVKDVKEAEKAIEDLLDENYEPPLFIDQKIPGHEFSVAAWTDGESWEVFPIAEANFSEQSDDIKGEDDKSTGGAKAGEQNTIPAKISDSLKKKLGETTVQVLDSFGITTWGRVDYRMPIGSRTPMVIDVNAEPDITEDTLFVECAKAAGLTYDDIILGILDKTIARYERKWAKSQEGAAEVKPMSSGEPAVK